MVLGTFNPDLFWRIVYYSDNLTWWEFYRKHHRAIEEAFYGI